MISDQEILNVFNEIFHTQHTSLEIQRSQVPEWDSMKHAELIIKLQKKFKLRFKAKDISKVAGLVEIKQLMQSI